MKHYICPSCGKETIDDVSSTRFRCKFCGEPVDGWKEELHEKLKEALQGKNEETQP